MLEIRVLGGLALAAGGEPRPLPETARGRALLAFCALHPGPHPRARLAAVLRPDVLDRSARATLRQAIWALRQAVGEGGEGAIVADRERFGLREDSIRVDLLELRRRAASGDIEGALELAAGELLPELDDEWALAARDAHRDEVGELLARRAEAAAAAGDLDAAVAAARRAAEHDPRSERAARALMTRLAEAGDRPAALAAYSALCDRLRRELGVAPSPATRELAEAIRAGTVAPTAAPLAAAPPAAAPPWPSARRASAAPVRLPLPPRLAEPPRSPFLGRDGALRRLLAAWDGVAGGGRRMVEVWGDPGIGKTRVARELAVRVHERGGAVLFGCADQEPLTPFQPFAEALTHAVRELSDAELEEVAGPVARDLARLVPELAERLETEAPATDGDDRLRLFEAVACTLGALSARAPLLLVLDDAHWADGPTLKLLRHVLRSDRGPQRMLLLLTLRTGAAPPVEAEREVAVERVRLTGLDPEPAGALLAAAGCRAADGDRARIVERTEGNPFFLELFGDAGAADIPAGVREAIAQRLAGLPDAAREALVLAAVAGPAFDVEILEAAAGDADVLTALDEAVLAGVVEEDAAAFGRYRFRHALVREVLYHEPSRVRRARMHIAIARAVEARGGREAEVAHHLLAVLPPGDALRAVDAAARAARRAGSLLAHEEAATLYRRALSAEPGALRETDRAEMLIALGEAEQRAGAQDRARPALEEAAALAASANDGSLLARAALAHGGVGVVIASPDPVTVRLLRDALALLDAEDPLRARVQARLAVEVYYADREEAGALSAGALALARRCRDPAALAAALSARHVALWAPAHTEERLAVAAEMEEMALRAGDREQALQAHNWLVVDLLELGEVAHVDAAIAAYERAARDLGLPTYRWYVPLWRAMRATIEGRWAAAEALSAEARAAGLRAQDANADLFWLLQHTTLLVEQRRFGDLDVEAVRRHAAGGPAHAWDPWLAWVAAERGERDEARAILEPLAPEGFAALREDANWHILVEAAEAVAVLGEREWAAQLYERLLPHAHLHAVVARAVATYGPTSYFLGRLAATCERWAAADAHFAGAAVVCERVGAAPRLALARWQRERLRAARAG